MNRGLVLSLSAIVLGTIGLTAAQAQTVDLSLNLRYTDPANPLEGGTWELVAKVDSGLGISAINALLSDVDNGVAPDDIALGGSPAGATTLGAIDPIDPGGANERPAYLTYNAGFATDLIYAQDITAGSVGDVGTGVGTPGDNGTDVLRNIAWDNAALIASGTFSSGTRPTFTTKNSNFSDSNVFTIIDVDPLLNTSAQPLGGTTTTVRGDSLETLLLENTAGTGLLAGDVNRDGIVNGSDAAIFGGNWLAAVLPGVAWNSGDFNNDDLVNGSDAALLGGNWLASSTPPALTGLSAVPEPSTLLLASAAMFFGFFRRRNSLCV